MEAQFDIIDSTDKSSIQFPSADGVCLICLNNVLPNGTKTPRANKNDVSVKLYKHFIDFCVQYLKVSIDVAGNVLESGSHVVKQEHMSDSVTACADALCTRCEKSVRNTLNFFEEMNELKVKLLGSVNQIGLMISKSSGGNFFISDGIKSFRNEVEHKCFSKAQIIQPTIHLGVNRSCTRSYGIANSEEVDVGPVKLNDREVEDSCDENEWDEVQCTSYLEDPLWSPETGHDKEGKSSARKRKRETRTGEKMTTRLQYQTCQSINENLSVQNDSLTAPSSPELSSNNDDDDEFEGRRKTRKQKKKLPTKGTNQNSTKRPRSTHRYGCSQCQLKIKSKSDFFEHNLKVHEGVDVSKYMECTVCSEKQYNVTQLQKHLENNHENQEEKTLFCVHCSDSFTTEQLRELHMRLVHTICPHILCEVDECPEKFIFVSDYNKHLASHCLSSEVIHSCSLCGRGFQHKFHCELHKLYHISKNNEGFLVCPIQECKKNNKYRHANKLMNHYNNLHLPKESQLSLHRCNQCKKSPYFIFKKDLLIHLKTHTRDLECQICKEKFIGHNALTVHYFHKHPNEFNGNLVKSQRQTVPDLMENPPLTIPEPFKGGSEELTLYRMCPYCSKSFSTYSEMAKHKAREHQIQRNPPPKHVQCEVCGTTVQKGQLTRHMLCHDEPHIPCPYPPCTKKFRREENLKMHVKKLHDRKESDREFVCDTCGKRYLSQGLMNRHIKEQHLKRYPCHLCPKKFSTIGRVNEHLRASHTDEKFQCKWCPSQFGWLCKLKVHARKKHPEQAHLLNSIYKYGMKPKAISYTEVKEESSGEGVVAGPTTTSTINN